VIFEPFVDLNGDGILEYISLASNGIEVANLKGEVVLSVSKEALPQKFAFFRYTGEFDGKLGDELLMMTKGELIFVDGSGRVRAIKSPVNSLVVAAGDIDGDGRDEILGQGEFFDFNQNKLTKLQNAPSTWLGYNEIWDMDGQGMREIGYFSMDGEMMVYSAAGQLIYHETFGDAMFHRGIVRSKGREHLVVHLSEKTLIYP
jgi:hypothetical protein